VSTIHAEFILRDWDVQVVDRASRNGTFVSEDDGETWQRLDADEPRTIRPGAQVSFASRIATFETSHRPGG
jgi:pSer/pThr/pTyr-binding forkhead associated (FHA) protein